jgi:hypothetical protein
MTLQTQSCRDQRRDVPAKPPDLGKPDACEEGTPRAATEPRK